MKGLVATGLAKRYQNRVVVDDLSLHVQGGEVVGLLGPNGAGKTTAFYMIVGLVKADAGTVHLEDYNLTPLPMHGRARRGVGYLPQEPSVFRNLTVSDNIAAVLELNPLATRDQIRHKTHTLMDELNISHIRMRWAFNSQGANVDAWKLHARSLRNRNLSYWTSRLPALIRFPYMTFNPSFNISRIAALGF